MTCRPTAAASRSAAGLLCLALLAACAAPSRGTLPPLDGADGRNAVLAGLDSYGFGGRIAVRDGDEGFNGNLNWEQRGDYVSIRVSGPLGAGTVLISGDPERLEVTDDNGEVTELEDPELDLRLRYGWRIPVASLRYWALGIPDPAEPATAEYDEDGRVTELVQGGWNVTIGQYREAGGRLMPRRLTAEQGASRVRLVIDRWAFH